MRRPGNLDLDSTRSAVDYVRGYLYPFAKSLFAGHRIVVCAQACNSENEEATLRAQPKLVSRAHRLIPLISVVLAAFVPVSAQDKAQWQSRVTGTFAVISGDLSTASRIAILATGANSVGENSSSGTYGAVLGLPLNLETSDPETEARRATVAFNLLRFNGVAVDVWAQGLSGLIVRSALDSLTDSSFVRCVILVDVPNRGVSPSGWPEWAALDTGTHTPPWAISGSKFLRELNAKTATQAKSLRTINVWRRGPQSTSRATVMQLPRAAIASVVDASTGPLLNLLGLPVAAVRHVGIGGPPPRRAAGVDQYVEEARAYAPRAVKEQAPLLGSLLAGDSGLPPESLTAWIEYQPSGAPQSSDRLARMTDVLGARWLPARNSLIVAGYEDYFRDPLRTDVLVAAFDAYKQQQPAISIDPRRPGDPPNQAPVRYESGIAGTGLGGLMFEADRVMKILSLGKDNITAGEIGSDVADFNPIARLDSQHYGSADAVWRLWFEPERWHSFEPDKYSTVLDARFRINWQKMSEGYAPSQPVLRFVDTLNRNFAEYAQEQPALAQLDGTARLIALANWLVEAKLDLRNPGQQLQFHTPSYTPLIEVSATGEFGRFKVVQVVQGGTVAGIRVRHVSSPVPPVDAVLKRALASIYPPAAVRPPPPIPTRGPHVAHGHIPAVSSRPPPANVGFVVDDILYQAAAFSALPLGPTPGIALARDSATDPPATIDDIIRERALAPQMLTASIDDAGDGEASPVLFLKGNRFGKDSGQVVFNDNPLRILMWSDKLVAAAATSPLVSGQILLRTKSGESNPIQLQVIPGIKPQESPKVTFENATGFSIVALVEPELFGSYRGFTLQPGAKVATKVVPGSYTVLGYPADQTVLVSQNNSTKQFKSGYEYVIRFEPRDFPVSKVTIQNGTGGPLSFRLQGPISRVLTIQSGTTTLQVAPGSYHIDIGSSCGQSTRDLSIGPGTNELLTYQCERRRF